MAQNKSIHLFLMKFGRKTGCHQRADRSFFFYGKQFPICARCTGVLFGYTITPFIALFKNLNYKYCIAFMVIMFLDWLLQYLQIRESTNARRFITGILGGFGIMGMQILIFMHILNLITEYTSR